jgi:hypothetical protein
VKHGVADDRDEFLDFCPEVALGEVNFAIQQFATGITSMITAAIFVESSDGDLCGVHHISSLFACSVGMYLVFTGSLKLIDLV